jgi:hypothetical protein
MPFNPRTVIAGWSDAFRLSTSGRRASHRQGNSNCDGVTRLQALVQTA